MPDRAGSWPNLINFCVALSLAAATPGNLAHAANDARFSPEQGEISAAFLFTLPHGDFSLTGFDCDLIAGPSSRVFAADPDYSETPSTIGLEVFLEDVNAPPAHLSKRLEMDGGLAADATTPLSTRLSAISLHDQIPAFAGDGEMENVFVPEASMSVADLVALCIP
jgi:hypothetical protein